MSHSEAIRFCSFVLHHIRAHVVITQTVTKSTTERPEDSAPPNTKITTRCSPPLFYPPPILFSRLKVAFLNCISKYSVYSISAHLTTCQAKRVSLSK